MHCTAVGLELGDVCIEVERTMEVVTRGDSGGGSFIAGSLMNIVQRSRAGDRRKI